MIAEIAPYVISTDAIDGNEALCSVPQDYCGPVKLQYSGRDAGQEFAVFPDFKSGKQAAAAAVRNDVGGYSDVLLSVAHAGEPLTHSSFYEWFAE